MTEPKASRPLLDGAILKAAVSAAVRKLDPRLLWRNPVIFMTEVVALLSLILALRDLDVFYGQIAAWLWFTVLFATFAEAVAEGRGKAQASALRGSRQDTTARRLSPDGRETLIPAADLKRGDRVSVAAGEIIPGDGEVIDGIASVDESAMTGESAPVIREAGGDRSAVTGGTRVLSDRILVEITADPGDSVLDRMIALVEGARRRKTPNEIALSILLAALSLIFLVAVATLPGFAVQSGADLPVILLIALLVTLIPTTIGGLLPAIGIAGMDRLLGRGVIAKSGRAIEAAGDVDTLLLDKTGTITHGNRLASALIPAPGVPMTILAEAAALASAADSTPEGRSIVRLIAERHGIAAEQQGVAIPFTAQTRMSGADIGGISFRKGAADAVVRHLGRPLPAELAATVEQIAKSGGTPLVVVRGAQALGAVHLKDVVKSGIRDRFAELRRMGIRTIMVTGDNPLTAAAIAAEAGVDDFIAEATPEQKLAVIRAEQADGRLVAMCGDGTNDAPALAQADVGLAMNLGTAAAREAGNMVDLDSDPTKLIDVVMVGKQLLMSRGSLTTFSLANDVAKFFAILPALFAAAYPQLAALNIMGLASPASAILSAVIFNAVILIALIPLALKGVRYRPLPAASLLRRNLLIYGLGGLLLPFAGIKLIDLLVTTMLLV
jgi:K+-transporting ATPase ATPase B chain